MCKKANEFIRKQKNKWANELICKLQRPGQSQYGMLEAFMINFILKIFC